MQCLQCGCTIITGIPVVEKKNCRIVLRSHKMGKKNKLKKGDRDKVGRDQFINKGIELVYYKKD